MDLIRQKPAPSLRLTDRNRLQLWCAVALGLTIAGLFWSVFNATFPVEEYCQRHHARWVFQPFERHRYTAMAGGTFLSVIAAVSLAYLGALRLARALTGRRATAILLGLVPLVLALVLVPAYPFLSNDIIKYVFDGRIMVVYGQNPFLHVPADFPQDPFFELITWKTTVNAHGPLWRWAEAASASVGGESCPNAILAMKVWPTLAYFATTVVLYRILWTQQPERAIWGTMVYAWNPLVVLEALGSGHNDVVAALPAALAVWLTQRGRIIWAFPLLAIAVLIKPIALVLGPLLLIAMLRQEKTRRRDVALGIALAAGLMVLAYLPFWAGSKTFQGLSRGHMFSDSPAKALLVGLQSAGIPSSRAIPIASGTANGLFLLGLLPLLLAVWTGRLPLVAAACGVFFLYLLIGAQWFKAWYVLWLAPLATSAPEMPPRVLGMAFMLMAPIAYVVNETVPAIVALFFPLLILAVYWRAWLGWPGRVGESRPAGDRRWQMAGG